MSNSLICVPNFSDELVLYNWEYVDIYKKLFGYMDSTIFSKDIIKKAVSKTLWNLDVNMLRTIYILRLYFGVDFHRFIKEIITVSEFVLVEKYFVEKLVDGKLKKYSRKKKHTFSIEIKCFGLRKNVLLYLEWFIDRINFQNDKINYDGSLSGKVTILHSKKFFSGYIDDLKKSFDYYSTKKSNSSFDDYLNFNVNRLLSQDIVLKSHEEMRGLK